MYMKIFCLLKATMLFTSSNVVLWVVALVDNPTVMPVSNFFFARQQLTQFHLADNNDFNDKIV